MAIDIIKRIRLRNMVTFFMCINFAFIHYHEKNLKGLGGFKLLVEKKLKLFYTL